MLLLIQIRKLQAEIKARFLLKGITPNNSLSFPGFKPVRDVTMHRSLGAYEKVPMSKGVKEINLCLGGAASFFPLPFWTYLGLTYASRALVGLAC